MSASDLKQDIAVKELNDELAGCSVCPHPWHDHDRIAARFCTATADRQFSRGCVCAASKAVKPGAHRR